MPYPAFMANGVQSAKRVTQKTPDDYDYWCSSENG